MDKQCFQCVLSAKQNIWNLLSYTVAYLGLSKVNQHLTWVLIHPITVFAFVSVGKGSSCC